MIRRSSPLALKHTNNRASSTLLLSLVGLVLTAVCVSLGIRTYALEAEIRVLDAQQEETAFLLERQQKALMKMQPIYRPDAAQQDIQAILDTSWIPLLSGLDSIRVPQVSLLSLAPDAEGHQLQLEIEAPSIEQATAYAEALEALTTLEQVHIGSQQPVPANNQRTGNSAVFFHFILHARWSAT